MQLVCASYQYVKSLALRGALATPAIAVWRRFLRNLLCWLWGDPPKDDDRGALRIPGHTLPWRSLIQSLQLYFLGCCVWGVHG